MYKMKVDEIEGTLHFTLDKHQFAIVSADLLTEAKWILFPLCDSEKEKHVDNINLATAIKRDEIKSITIEISR